MKVGTLELDMICRLARLQSDMDRAKQVVNSAAVQIDKSVQFAKNALASLGLGIGLGAVIATTDAYTKYSAQLRLATQTEKEYATAREEVRRISNLAQQDLAATGVLYARITNATRELGTSQRQVNDITEVVSLSLKASGATQQEAASATLQLSQAFASGKLRGEEFNAVNEAAPRLMKALADGIGVPVGALREMAKAGELTSEVMAKALPRALKDLRTEAAQVQTIAGAFQVLKNNVTEFVGAQAQANGSVALLTSALTLAAENLNAIMSAVAGVTVTKFAAWAADGAMAVYTKVAALVASAAALEHERQGNIKAATAEIARSEATIAFIAAARAKAIVEMQAAQATIAATQAVGAYSGALALNTAAKQANSLATAELAALGRLQATTTAQLTAAQGALAAATGATGAAASLATRALGLLGGPIGIITTLIGLGATAWMLWGRSSEDATTKAKESIGESTIEIVRNLEKQNAKLRERADLLSGAAGRAEAKAEVAPAQKALADQLKIITEMEAKQLELKTQGLRLDRDQQFALDYARQQYERINQQLQINVATRREIESGALESKQAEWMGKYANNAERLAAELAKAKKELGDMFTPELEARIRERFKEKDAKPSAAQREWLKEEARIKREALDIEEDYQKEVAEAQKLGADFMIKEQKRLDKEQSKQQKDANAAALKAEEMFQKDLKEAWDAVAKSDDQSKLLKSIDDFLDPSKAQSFGDALRDSFGAAGSALAGLSAAFSDYARKEAALQEHRAAIARVNDPRERAAREQVLAQQTARTQIGAYAQMAGAAKGFFKEGTKGYKALEAAERTFQAFQLASDLVKGVSAAAVAIANQAQGDPYTAWARMALMAAAMAALGFAVGGIGGGGGGEREAGSVERQRTQGTGTVLGDSDAKSNSIANALEILRDNSSEELLFQSKMLASLVNIESSMAGMAAAVARYNLTGANVTLPGNEGGGWTGGSNTFSLDDAGIIIGRILNANSSDPGQLYGGQTVADLIRGAQATGFTDIAREHGGMRSYTAVNREHDALPQQLISDISRTVGAMRDAIAEAVFILTDGAVSLEEVKERLANVNIDPTTISFADLAGGDIADALMAVFSSIGDTMVTAIVGDIEDIAVLESFQRVGEGAFETLIRVASGIETARSRLDTWGIEMIRWQDIANTQGDVTTELIRDSVVLAETTDGVVSGVGQIIAGFDGTADEMGDLYDKLLNIQQQMDRVGVSGEELSQAMITAAGGLSKFTAALDTYFSEFFTTAERTARQTEELKAQFTALGLEMPATREGFRALVESIDRTTVEGQALWAELIALAPAFAGLVPIIQDVSGAIHDAYIGNRATLADKMMSDFERRSAGVIGEQPTELGKMTLRSSLIGAELEQIEARKAALEAEFGGTVDRVAEYQALIAVQKKLSEQLNGKGGLTEDIGALIVLIAEHGEEMGEELFALDEWYEAQKKLVGDNQVALLALEEIYARKREEILLEGSETITDQWIEDIRRAQESIKEFLRSLKLDPELSPLSPRERMAEAQRQYMDLLAKAQAGDADAMSKLPDAARTYMDLARQIFGSSADFVAIFDRITAELRALSDSELLNAPHIETVEAKPSPEMHGEFEDLREEIREMRREARNGFDDVVTALAKGLNVSDREAKEAIEQHSRKMERRGVAALP